MKKLLIGALIVILVVAAGLGYVAHRQSVHRQQLAAAEATKLRAARSAQAAAKAKQLAAPAIQPAFSKTALSTDDPSSLWVVVNKLRPLQPRDYAPNDLVVPNIPVRLAGNSSEMQLRRAAAQALERMAAAATIDGAHLMVASGYRSYGLQVSVYESEVKSYGQTKADSESARPGFSEHQTGLAVDLEPTSRQCEVADCFADTAEGKWLAIHAAEYGFMQRYTPDKSAITGYRAEAWHFRYVGPELTAELKKQQVTTLEEFFGLPAAPAYAT